MSEKPRLPRMAGGVAAAVGLLALAATLLAGKGAGFIVAAAVLAVSVGLVAGYEQWPAWVRGVLAAVAVASFVTALVLLPENDEDDRDVATKPGTKPVAIRKLQTFGIGAHPRALVADRDGVVWVVGDDEKHEHGTLHRVDFSDVAPEAEPIESYHGERPFDVDVGEDGVWVTDHDRLLQFSRSGRKVWGRRFSKAKTDNEVAAVVGHLVVYKRTNAGEIVVLDARSHRELGRVRIGPEATAIGAGPTGVWVTSRFSKPPTVFKIDLHYENSKFSYTKLPVKTRKDPEDLVVGGSFVWITHAYRNIVSRVNPLAQGGPRELNRANRTRGDFPSGIDYGPTGAWVSHESSSTVTLFDPCTGERLGTKKAGDSPYDIAVLGRLTVTADFASKTLSRFERVEGAALCR